MDFVKSVLKDELQEYKKDNLIQLSLFLKGTKIGKTVNLESIHKDFAHFGDSQVKLFKPWLIRLMQTDEYRDNKEEFVTKVISLINGKNFYPFLTTRPFDRVLSIEREDWRSTETDLDTLYIENQQKLEYTYKYSLESFKSLKTLVFARAFEKLFNNLPRNIIDNHQKFSLGCRILLREKYQLDLIITSTSFLSQSHALGIYPEAIINELAGPIEEINALVNAKKGAALNYMDVCSLINQAEKIFSEIKLF